MRISVISQINIGDLCIMNIEKEGSILDLQKTTSNNRF